ncbi:MAG: hypothetical protein AAF772_19580 [Acidobacteriota bacterium]
MGTGPRLVLVLAGLIVLAFLPLLGLQRSHQLGPYATSPQRVEIPYDQRRIVAGGRALVGFTDRTAEGLTFEIQCNGIHVVRTVAVRSAVDDVCGVAIRPVQVWGALPPDPIAEHVPLRTTVEVTWTD